MAFPLWIFFLAAALIATAAFVLGQAAPGLGVAFAAAASVGWTAYASGRRRRAPTRRG